MALKSTTGQKPVFMTGTDPVELRLKDLFDILDAVRDAQHGKDLEQLVQSGDLRVLVPAETVNAFKNFVAARSELRDTEVGAKILFPSAEPMGRSSGRARCCGFDSSG
ncbi:hypothetical protein [Pararhizobium sp. PWRC1-1]|uniref:hypothetical protein n=1 Tax=Pararhizobium sp. PWRC1-1 TaxID=2804566 RepID=UPI003CF815CE